MSHFTRFLLFLMSFFLLFLVFFYLICFYSFLFHKKDVFLICVFYKIKNSKNNKNTKSKLISTFIKKREEKIKFIVDSFFFYHI